MWHLVFKSIQLKDDLNSKGKWKVGGSGVSYSEQILTTKSLVTGQVDLSVNEHKLDTTNLNVMGWWEWLIAAILTRLLFLKKVVKLLYILMVTLQKMVTLIVTF